MTSPITTLFVDIGGVLFTNAWDNDIRIPEMIELMDGLKSQHGFEIAAVRNEERELTMYRLQ